jgi:SSS family solute:Na+ symporter
MTYPLATIVFSLLIAAFLIMGFGAGRASNANLQHIKEWGLAGRQFGTWSIWFLLGADIFTAQATLVDTGRVAGAGAAGFFSVPYTLLICPLMYVFLPKFWYIARRYGYITAAEFVRGRYGNRWLALAVGATGVIATIPYIALQLKGLQTVIAALGITGDLPIIIAFGVVAGFTLSSGLRAPAFLAIVKDVLIALVIIVAFIIIPYEMGGFAKIFAKISVAQQTLATPPPGSGGAYSTYATLAIGQAMALLLYPHIMTAVLSASSSNVLRRNAAMVPGFTFLFGLAKLLAVASTAAGLSSLPQFIGNFHKFGANFAFLALCIQFFPNWFAGLALGAIGVAAIVPAAIMAIAAATIVSRDIYSQFSKREIPEIMIAKIAALALIAIGMIFAMAIPGTTTLEFQLLGGIWIIQTFPAVILSVFTRFFNGWALLAGWAAGIALATTLVVANHLSGPTYNVNFFGYAFPSYIAFSTVFINIGVATVLSIPLNLYASDRSRDQTTSWDYF